MVLTQRSGIIVGTLAKLLGFILNLIYNVMTSMGVENIAVCIIIFTIFVRLCMYPLSLKTTKSSKIQNFLQPEFNKINKKYRNKKDQDSLIAMNKETRALQEKYGIKMTAGCLTSLIQFPIIYALYAVIQNIPAYVGKVKEMYLPIANMISDSKNFSIFEKFVTDNNITHYGSELIADPNHIIDYLCVFTNDQWNSLIQQVNGNSELIGVINQNLPNIQHVNSFILGINTNEAPGWHIGWALLIPIASCFFQFLSMKVTPMQDSADPQQQQSMQMMKSMMMVMPIMSFVITIGVPAGVGLYWSVSALISFITIFLTNKYYDHADMEAIVKKEEEKAAKKNAKKKNSGKKSFMDRLMEAASDQSEQEKKNPNYMKNINSQNLKNYVPTGDKTSDKADTNKSSVKYKPGSIAAKANAMQQYNDKGGKE